MPRWQVQHDLAHWQEVLAWLAARPRVQAGPGPAAANLVSIDRPSAESAPVAAGFASVAARE
jgi:hypothetical protein